VDLSGVWSGEYRYDSDGPRPSVTFTLRLHQRLCGRIRGVVTDGSGGMPGEGRVVGVFRKERLQFQKFMPVARVRADVGTRPLKEHLAGAGHTLPGPDVPHPPILYDGVVSEGGSCVRGTWRIEEGLIPLADGVRAFRVPASCGSWEAKRADQGVEQSVAADG